MGQQQVDHDPAERGDVKMQLEIVTHCWRYWRALTYQISSLILHPPVHSDVLLTVFCSPEEDENTAKRLEQIAGWDLPTNISYRVWTLPRGELCRRAIGRNMAAQSTAADVVWFIDCDMTLGDGAVDALASQVWSQPEGVLFYPRWVQVPEQKRGDKILMAATEVDGPCEVDQTGFMRKRYNRAIGGVQIVDGDCCRAVGYLPDSKKYQRPAEEWARTFEDRAYRGWLDKQYGSGRGRRLELPEVCRIRHTQRGRFDRGLEL